MFEAKFRLKHRGCWTNGLKKFKGEFITHNTASLSENFVQDITEVNIERTEKRKIKNYFKNHRLIKKFEILEETENKLLIQIFTDTNRIKSIVHTIINNKCFLSEKVLIENGWEVWSIAAPKKTAIKNTLEGLKGLGELKLLYIKKSSFDGINLSSSQEKVLKSAIELGYYNWPRKITLEDLSKRFVLSKATVAEHLRKAEIKIILRKFGR